jgi:hypothetical protein
MRAGTVVDGRGVPATPADYKFSRGDSEAASDPVIETPRSKRRLSHYRRAAPLERLTRLRLTICLTKRNLQLLLGRGFGLNSDGASRTRTGDLLGAIQALSQLSYSPAREEV